jgi:hypothetical protein
MSLQRGADATDFLRNKSVNASGGDTLAFEEEDTAAWARSIRVSQNWRITSYRTIRLLSDLPGLDNLKCKKDPSVSLKTLLEKRLKVSAWQSVELALPYC